MKSGSFGSSVHSYNWVRQAGLLSLSVAVLMLFGETGTVLPAYASGQPPVLWEVCPAGQGAGRCSIPRGVAANPASGHVFVADSENNRIVELNALGQFIKAWGWGVGTGAAEAQTCTEASGCQAGFSGSGAGQFGFFGPQGVAVDSAGSIYVVDRGLPSNARVQKFDRKGNFVLMFGGEVNKTKVEAGGASEEEENLCPFEAGDECKVGTEGTGPGQFGEWPFIGDWIAIDDNGTAFDTDDKVYVGDVNRIQVFDAGGHYQSEFAVTGTVQGLASDTAGNLYAIYGGSIQKLSPVGAPLPPETFDLPQFDFNPPVPTAVAVDSSGHVYAVGPTNCCGSQVLDPIVEFDPAGSIIAEFGKGELSASTGLATNLCSESEAPGNLYITNASSSEAFLRAYGTDPIGCFKARTLPPSHVEEDSATLNGTVNASGLAVSECFFEYGTNTAYGQIAQCEEPNAAEIGSGSAPVQVHADIGGLERGTIYHVRLIAKVGGETETGADATFKTLGPPVFSNEHVVGASSTEATLKATVNPEGFSTVYHFEYVKQAAFDESEFANAQSTAVMPIGSDRIDHPAIANLNNLVPGTAYRWRIVATSTAAGSPVVNGEAHSLFTYLPFRSAADCPNQEFRTGESASLPDCRGYEMVSPIDKNGGDIFRELTGADEPGAYVQASPDGNSLTYTSLAAFPNSPNAFNFNQYLATRHGRTTPGEGWSSQGLHTPTAGQEVDDTIDTFGFLREFMAFSPDLCSAWFVDYQTPAPTADGQAGYPNLYRRDNCGTGDSSFEALVPGPKYELPSGTPKDYVNRNSVQGYSEDSRHAIFGALAKLTPEAAGGGGAQLYDRFCATSASEACSGGGEALSLVNVLPSGSPGDPTPGDGMGFAASSGVANSVSSDGSLVYWTGGGGVFVRKHPEQGIVASECSEAAVACTLQVSAGGAEFWAAASDGSKALYSESEDLHVFDLKTAEEGGLPAPPIAHGVKGVVGASEDLSRIFFVSTDVLPGVGENSEGDQAAPGEANLYLDEEGAFIFIGTLLAGDVGAKEPGASVLAYNLVGKKYLRATRVSASGNRIAFESRAQLTGFDNTGPDGRASVEVFTYEAGGGLDCVSCSPSGARPSGVRELREPYTAPWHIGFPTSVSAAAYIPTWEHPLHASNVLSADGARLFFNANDALVPGDTNGAPDVYEWEALGTGGCNPKDSNYFIQNGGCLYLISSGKSPTESEFWEASPDGRDVFFSTASSLVSQDPGSVDLYDARVGGGFPEPDEKAPCAGEACQSPPAPPEFPAPASNSYDGPDNPPRGGKTHCARGKRKVRRNGKTRCIPKQSNKERKRSRRGTDQNRRAAR